MQPHLPCISNFHHSYVHHLWQWLEGVPGLLYNLPQSSSLPICHFPLCREWQGLPGWPTPLLNPHLCDWNRTFHDQEPMCPIHDMCKNALLPGIWNFHCVFYLITLVDSEIRSKCNLHQESEYCIASPLNYIARAKRHLSRPFLASLTLSFLHSSYLRVFSLSLYWTLCKLSFYATSYILYSHPLALKLFLCCLCWGCVYCLIPASCSI